MSKNESFKLQGADIKFNTKSDNIFNQLSVPRDFKSPEAKETNQNSYETIKHSSKLKYNARKTFNDRQVKPSSFQNVRNRSDKWKKYDLSSIDVNKMSDRSNASIALNFLNGLKRQNMSNERHGIEDSSDLSSVKTCSETLNFNKRIAREKSSNESSESSKKHSFINGRHTLPEYVVGQTKIKSNIRKRTFKPGSCSNDQKPAINLSHLDEEDDSNSSPV